MKMINDITLIEAELRRRDAWDGFADGSTKNRTVIFEKNIFYRQRGYDQSDMNYAVWLKYDDEEAGGFENAVSFF